MLGRPFVQCGKFLFQRFAQLVGLARFPLEKRFLQILFDGGGAPDAFPKALGDGLGPVFERKAVFQGRYSL